MYIYIHSVKSYEKMLRNALKSKNFVGLDDAHMFGTMKRKERETWNLKIIKLIHSVKFHL